MLRGLGPAQDKSSVAGGWRPPRQPQGRGTGERTRFAAAPLTVAAAQRAAPTAQLYHLWASKEEA